RGYRFARRAFLRSVGGALGLRTILGNLEAAAQQVPSPPRLLVVHHPVGTVRPDWEPKGTGTTYTTSRLLKPFEDANLRANMAVIYGLSNEGIGGPGGVGHQKGQVIMMTGTATKFVRAGELIDQDTPADGPSFDQILLKNVKALQTPKGYVNAIADNRVDYNPETSTRCLSYDYATRPVQATAANGVENIPLFPELSPLQLYISLFGSMAPGGAAGMSNDQLIRALKERRSVLDYSLRELARIKTLAPASDASKIQLHTDAIRKIETQLSAQIANGTVTTTTCGSTPPPDVVGGKYDGGNHRDYDNPTATASDETVHAQVGKLHLGVIKSAFVCDLVRVATFQWSPGVNHIAFKGLYPGEPNSIYMHHPLSHRINSADTRAAVANRKPEVEFLSKVDEFYATQTASIVADFKATTDGVGGALLDNTILPYVTEVAACGHEYYPLPAILFGGQKLGIKGGQYQYLDRRPHNDLWLTVAKALGLTPEALKSEKFMQDAKNATGPITQVVA
ncbi:MAG: DUF1552 domain-containing protein, partial [Pseudomonadota bacterium]